MKLKDRILVIKTPRECALVYGNSYYLDNGRAWSEEEEVPRVFSSPEGVRRIMLDVDFADPVIQGSTDSTGRFTGNAYAYRIET